MVQFSARTWGTRLDDSLSNVVWDFVCNKIDSRQFFAVEIELYGNVRMNCMESCHVRDSCTADRGCKLFPGLHNPSRNSHVIDWPSSAKLTPSSKDRWSPASRESGITYSSGKSRSTDPGRLMNTSFNGFTKRGLRTYPRPSITRVVLFFQLFHLRLT